MKRSFDRLAQIYRVLEFLAFGGDLERARFRHLAELRDCRSILIAGEGDGRCLQQLLSAAPQARITCVDISAGMIARARERIAADSGARERVEFIQADIREWAPPAGPFDAIVTLFVLDCFDPAECEAIVARWVRVLAPVGWWLWADFVEPASGWRRWRARIWLRVLYTFFRWQTGLDVRALPPAETIIRDQAFEEAADISLQHGLIRSVAFRRLRKIR
ncbi:MAG TPA: methyltransferase domain-containing protein [Candidatus Didemnitutus sp.]|nr:methyltransferase domain-containing protein [Candidatus Didemnitutus sp.]